MEAHASSRHESESKIREINSYMIINIQLFLGANNKTTHNLYIKMIFTSDETVSTCAEEASTEKDAFLHL